MKFNWLVRIRNPNFWIGLIGIFMMAMGVDASMLTSWQIVIDNLIELIKNPFMIGSVLLALWGYVQDFTTKGVGDTDRVMTYTEPGKCSETVADESVDSEESEVE